MRIGILGCGWVGTVTAVVFAQHGYDVAAYDVDEEKIIALSQGHISWYEPGLSELLQAQLAAGRLRFVRKEIEVLQNADILFCCVGTPPQADGSANIDAIFTAAEMVALSLAQNEQKVFVIKSTVPPGTGAEVARRYPQLLVASNPEFLAEGTAVHDALTPSRIVYGSDDDHATEVLAELYRPWQEQGTPLVAMKRIESEMTKYAANAFLATKISFMNEMAELCEAFAANPSHIAQGIALDPRIGTAFLRHGLGYGGSCFPKDTQALLAVACAHDITLPLVAAAEERNFRQRERYVKKIIHACGGSVQGKTIAILGLAYKPHTDDVRGAPALDLIRLLEKQGAYIKAYDPMVHTLPSHVHVQLFSSIDEATSDVDAVCIATDWPEIIAWKNMTTMPFIDGRPA